MSTPRPRPATSKGPDMPPTKAELAQWAREDKAENDRELEAVAAAQQDDEDD